MHIVFLTIDSLFSEFKRSGFLKAEIKTSDRCNRFNTFSKFLFDLFDKHVFVCL